MREGRGKWGGKWGEKGGECGLIKRRGERRAGEYKEKTQNECLCGKELAWLEGLFDKALLAQGKPSLRSPQLAGQCSQGMPGAVPGSPGHSQVDRQPDAAPRDLPPFPGCRCPLPPTQHSAKPRESQGP